MTDNQSPSGQETLIRLPTVEMRPLHSRPPFKRSSFPAMRYGVTPCTTEIRIVPVTLETDIEGVTKTASTGFRPSTYLPSKDNASSSVTFMPYGFVWATSGGLCNLLLLSFYFHPSRSLKRRDLLTG